MYLGKLQKHLVCMFNWFHNYCFKHNLRYYAIGGTMLGAMRHQGFIPWDDDIDVGMPRKDYNRLLQLLGNKEYDGYFLETPYSSSFAYRYPYSKLYDVNTTLIEHTWPILKRGVFIDVFPLDGLGNDFEEAYKNWNAICVRANFIWSRMCALNKNRSVIKNLAILAAHMIPKKLGNDKKILVDMNLMCQKNDYDQVLISGNVFGNWGKKEIMLTSVFGTPKKYKFENIEIYGANDADAYLTNLYGDWRKLPAKEKRITHHDYLKLDLLHGYM